jgi:HK97 family phage major capsid protein
MMTVPTLDSLSSAAVRRREDAARRRRAAYEQRGRILQLARAEGRGELTAAEGQQWAQLTAAHDQAHRDYDAAAADVARLEQVQAEEAAYLARSREIYPGAVPPGGQPVYGDLHRIGAEPAVYRSPAERGLTRPGEPGAEPSFLHDLYMAQVRHDPAAGGRLERHGRQFEDEHPGWAAHQRAMGTAAVSGFVPPGYLSTLFAEYARAGRPIANLCAHEALPAIGMQFEVPRVTTPTQTAVQAAEGGAIGNQDLDDTLLDVKVCTIAGYVDVSRQAIERGVMVENLLFSDLSADYNSRLDLQLVNGSGSAGQHLGILNTAGINAISYTDATPTIPELWPKLADAVGKVVSGRFTGPTAIVMTPTAWAWILAERDSTGRPLVEPAQVAQNPIGLSEQPDYTRPAGTLFGVTVWLDGNIPANLGAGTNETRVITADFRDTILFEDGAAPAQLRFEDVLSSTLQIRLVAYGYSGFVGGRQPKAISVVSGTGLIVPAL